MSLLGTTKVVKLGSIDQLKSGNLASDSQDQNSKNWFMELVLIAIIVVISILFIIFPEFDIWFSDLFHAEEGGFWVKSIPLFNYLREIGPTLVWLVTLACIISLLSYFLIPTISTLFGFQLPIFLLVSLMLGPWIVVNEIFKDLWGRPRPHMTEIFGGEAPYVPVWYITDYCPNNCSFVSGEASISIWLVAVILVAPIVWRLPIAVVMIMLTLALSLNRIAFGGHFLSDVLLSLGITLLIMRLCYRFFFIQPPAFLTNSALSEFFAKYRLKYSS